MAMVANSTIYVPGVSLYKQLLVIARPESHVISFGGIHRQVTLVHFSPLSVRSKLFKLVMAVQAPFSNNEKLPPETFTFSGTCEGDPSMNFDAVLRDDLEGKIRQIFDSLTPVP